MSVSYSIQTENPTFSWRSLLALFGKQPRYFGIFYAIIFAQIMLLVAVALQSAVPVERLFRDMLSVAEDYPDCCHVYDGLISNLGILLWWAAASVTGFAALAVACLSGRRYDILALTMAAVFSAWLAIDDLFMLHETVLPLFGLPQPATYALYGAITIAYISLSWRVVLTASPLFLLMAISMLGLSVFIDILSGHGMDAISDWLLANLGAISHWLQANTRIEFLLEDGFKFLGIGFWCCLHMAAAMKVLVNTAAKGGRA